MHVWLRCIILEYFYLQKALGVLPAETRLTVYRRPRVLFRDEGSSVFVLGQWLGGHVFAVTFLIDCSRVGFRGRGSLICTSWIFQWIFRLYVCILVFTPPPLLVIWLLAGDLRRSNASFSPDWSKPFTQGTETFAKSSISQVGKQTSIYMILNQKYSARNKFIRSSFGGRVYLLECLFK